MYEVGDLEKPGVVDIDTERTDILFELLVKFFKAEIPQSQYRKEQ